MHLTLYLHKSITYRKQVKTHHSTQVTLILGNKHYTFTILGLASTYIVSPNYPQNQAPIYSSISRDEAPRLKTVSKISTGNDWSLPTRGLNSTYSKPPIFNYTRVYLSDSLPGKRREAAGNGLVYTGWVYFGNPNLFTTYQSLGVIISAILAQKVRL